MNETWVAVSREAALAAEHLASGATLLGKANYAQQAYYYQAFFALSVGFERSAKLALAIDRSLTTGSFPTHSQLRDYGHKLDALLALLDSMAQERSPTKPTARLPRTDIHDGIISVLSEFASNVTRYYNLDLITGSHRIAGVIDPIRSWHERVFIPVSRLHYSARRRGKVETDALLVEQLIGDSSLVRHIDESGELLTDVAEASA